MSAERSRRQRAATAAIIRRDTDPRPMWVNVRLLDTARDGLRREAGHRQAEDGTEWTLSRVVEALLRERLTPDEIADLREAEQDGAASRA